MAPEPYFRAIFLFFGFFCLFSAGGRFPCFSYFFPVSVLCAKGNPSLREFWKVQGFPFSGGNTFSLEVFILGLIFSFSLELLNPRPCLPAAREGLGSKKPFTLEKFMPYSRFFFLLFGRHLVGVWIGGVWNGRFPESEKYFSGAEISRKMPEIPLKKRCSPNFRLRNLKIQSPKKCNSMPPAVPYPH